MRTRILAQTLERILKDKMYHPVEAQEWARDITNVNLKELKSLADGAVGFKFVVHCSLVQKKNSGVHTNSSCFWNAETDGSVVVRYETPTVLALVTVYGLSLLLS